MDWRTPLRKIVNSEDHLGAVRLAVMRVIDPVEWYTRKNEEERRRPRRPPRTSAAGWTGYAPIEQERSVAGAEAPSILVPAPAEKREDADPYISEFWSRRDAVRREHENYFEGQAKDLLVRCLVSSFTWRDDRVMMRHGAVYWLGADPR